MMLCSAVDEARAQRINPPPLSKRKISAEFVSPFTFLRGLKPFWIKEGNLTGRRLY